MDNFLVCKWQKLEEPVHGRQLQILSVELSTSLDDAESMQWRGPPNNKRQSFTNLTVDNNFREAVLYIIKIINDLSLNFTNVRLVSDQTELFTKILPQEFAVRQISMPYVFTNFVDWKSLCEKKYPNSCSSIQEVAKAMSLLQRENGEVLSKVLGRLREEALLEDTDVAFRKEHQVKEELGGQFIYFRCVGLPFQISKHQIVQKLIEADRFNIKSYGLSLIFQHGKFSGKAVIKIPAQFNQMILSKDRMYIGKRYVEIIPIHQEEYQSYKFRELRQRENAQNARRPAHNSRSSSDSDSPSYSRSRSREKTATIQHLLNQAAIKVRGLPYSLNNWDVEDIFKKFNFVRGSIKLGYVGDRKSGEGVVLFPNREEAQRALSLHGLVVQNRYLQLRLITKENYDRFR